MSQKPELVTIPKCADLLGLTSEAIRQYIKKGQWREKIEVERAPNGRIFIRLSAVYQWIEGKSA